MGHAMKLVAPGPDRIVIAPVRPSAGVRASYERRLLKLINEMIKETHRQVLASYQSTMAQDAPLQSVLKHLRKKWVSNFDNMRGTISESFANNVLTHSDLAFKAALSKGGFSVPFKLTDPIKEKMHGITRENVDLIKTIPSEFFDRIHEQVMESVERGRDLGMLTERLHHAYGVTRRRAAFIARDQNNRATAAIHKLRQMSMGITKGIWRHTGGSVQPREEHIEFDGKTYDIELGHDFEDGLGPVQPGEAYNCGCVGSSVIPGYDEEPEEAQQAEPEGEAE